MSITRQEATEIMRLTEACVQAAVRADKAAADSRMADAELSRCLDSLLTENK